MLPTCKAGSRLGGTCWRHAWWLKRTATGFSSSSGRGRPLAATAFSSRTRWLFSTQPERGLLRAICKESGFPHRKNIRDPSPGRLYFRKPAIVKKDKRRHLRHENDFQHAVFSYTRVQDGDVFRLSSEGPEIRAVHMPGHTPGSTAYLIDRTYLISGDADLYPVDRPAGSGRQGRRVGQAAFQNDQDADRVTS